MPFNQVTGGVDARWISTDHFKFRAKLAAALHGPTITSQTRSLAAIPVPRQNFDLLHNQTDGGVSGFAGSSVSNLLMLRPLRLLLILAIRSVRSRRDLLLENLALRQQLAAVNPRTIPVAKRIKSVG
jgi:hypothetical protein